MNIIKHKDAVLCVPRSNGIDLNYSLRWGTFEMYLPSHLFRSSVPIYIYSIITI